MLTTFSYERVSQATADLLFPFKMIKSDGTDATALNTSNFTFRIWGPTGVEVTGFTVPTVAELANGRYMATFASASANKAFTTVNETVAYEITVTHSGVTGASADVRVAVKAAVSSEAAFATSIWAVTARSLTTFGTLAADTAAAVWGATETIVALIASIATAVWSKTVRALTTALTDEIPARDMAAVYSPAGSKAILITVTEVGTGTPISNAFITLMNSTETAIITVDKTDILGQHLFLLDPGDYVARITKPGVNLGAAHAFTVTVDASLAYTGILQVPTPPATAMQTLYGYSVHGDASYANAGRVTATPVGSPNAIIGGRIITVKAIETVMNSQGYFELQLIQGATYLIYELFAGVQHFRNKVTITTDSTKDLSSYTYVAP